MSKAAEHIPDMTHELGRHWKQPSRDEILVDDTHALMTAETRKKLSNYDCSIPTGVYDGKMWARTNGGRTWLCWYAPSDDPDKCSIETRVLVTI